MSVDIQQDKDKLLELLKKHAYFRERITLSSGKQSDYYIDARRVTLRADGVYLAARIMWEIIRDEAFEAIGGPTIGADPLLGALGVLAYADNTPVNFFIVRKTPKPHGRQQQIEGPVIPDGAEVILVDDVATTGKAFVEAIEVLKKQGVIARKALCIVDREEGAKEVLKKQGCELVALFTADDFSR